MNDSKFPITKHARHNADVDLTYKPANNQYFKEPSAYSIQDHPNKLESLSKYLMLKFLTVMISFISTIF